MPNLYTVGTNRIFYKAEGFGTGKTVTAYLWSPAMVKSDLQTFTEIESGLYYLDYTFAAAGVFLGLFYEDAVAKTFSTFRVNALALDSSVTALAAVVDALGIGTGPVAHAYTVTVDGVPCADCLVIMSTDAAMAAPIHSGRTNALGVVTFYPDLAAGTPIYLWRFKTGSDFTNPDTEEIHA